MSLMTVELKIPCILFASILLTYLIHVAKIGERCAILGQRLEKKGGNGFGTSAQQSSENMLNQGEDEGKV